VAGKPVCYAVAGDLPGTVEDGGAVVESLAHAEAADQRILVV
jgi:hypothetical protein